MILEAFLAHFGAPARSRIVPLTRHCLLYVSAMHWHFIHCILRSFTSAYIWHIGLSIFHISFIMLLRREAAFTFAAITSCASIFHRMHDAFSNAASDLRIFAAWTGLPAIIWRPLRRHVADIVNACARFASIFTSDALQRPAHLPRKFPGRAPYAPPPPRQRAYAGLDASTQAKALLYRFLHKQLAALATSL